jgi:hypothetical protein
VRGGKLQAKKSSNEPATPSDFFTHILPPLTLLKVWVFSWYGNNSNSIYFADAREDVLWGV